MEIKSRVRKCDKSHVEIILRVRQYFEEERPRGYSLNLNRVVARTAVATVFPKELLTG